MVKGTIDMKILPSDDLSNKPDYNRNYKKYFKEEVVENTVNTQSKPGLLYRVKQLLGLKSGNN